MSMGVSWCTVDSLGKLKTLSLVPVHYTAADPPRPLIVWLMFAVTPFVHAPD